MKKILFVCPYPLACAPSQRFRFEQYLDILIKNNFSYTFSPFLDEKTWQILYKNGFQFQKIIGILGGFWRRFLLLFSVVKYDYVFIHREASPIGLPFFEWITAKILRKKIIFDFDDAIWLPNTSENNKIVAKLKFHSKTHLICQWAYKTSVGNPYLLEYASKFKMKDKNILNPTTIDTENLHLFSERITSKKKIIIGWTGTHSTIKYLDAILPIILELEQRYTFEFRVISNQKPHFEVNGKDFTPKSFIFKEWNKTTEIEDLSAFDIGLMPLIDDIWAKGKCGFKALQYMAVGAVTLVSPVGVNTHIITHNADFQNGFICDSLQDFQNALIFILENPEKVENIRQNARKTIVERYSVLSNQANFLGLFAD